MNDPRLNVVLDEYGIPAYIAHADQASLVRVIASESTDLMVQPNPERLPRLAFLYESQGIASFQQGTAKSNEVDLRQARDYFQSAYTCWNAITSLPNGHPTGVSNKAISSEGIKLVTSEMSNEPISPELALAFHLAVTGLMSDRTADTRLELQRFSLAENANSNSWRDQVIQHIFSAFVLLVRKANGWEDIDRALRSISELRQLQVAQEGSYLDKQGQTEEQALAAVELVGLYHLAQIVTLIGDYLKNGKDSITQVNLRLSRHLDRAVLAFRTVRKNILSHLADLLWVGCYELAQNSIWTHLDTAGERVKQFARILAAEGRPNPVIELWPSQQEALRRNLLDTYRRAILVEMPTSAGKTLLAKFSIVQTKALNPKGTVVYIVPTRALVNQITLDLRSDFRGLNPPIRVEQAVPAFELDPTEERLLGSLPDILVTTPEKLDLLVRRGHPATQEISLVIADEAHNIQDENRGARLELLLGTIKRERPGARFLLLSPFLPNDKEILLWLGDNRALDPISVNWQPGRKLVGAVRKLSHTQHDKLIFETLPASNNTFVQHGLQIPIGEGTANTISALTRSIILSLLDRGSILVLCRGQGTAVTRANEVANELPELLPTAERDAVSRYLEAEIGRDSSLVKGLNHGVAYHHAGLSHEARWLIEGLIKSGDIKIVCGTTTLAQGVNFPITTVIVETLKKGSSDLSYTDFWNIAGRAGRALIDTVGVIAFPSPTPQKRQEYIEFLKDEAKEISSQLATLIDRADEIAETFNLKSVRNFPQLSSLLQFLAHALRVSGTNNIADEVEDILRASLVYHQARQQSTESARRLIRLCQAYLEQIGKRKDILALADKTGFATPSVLKLLAEKTANSELIKLGNWRPERLFGSNLEPLRERVAAIADLPEIQLGQGQGFPFNAERVAAILRDWVQGEPLNTLAQRYLQSDQTDPDKRIAEFSRYLFSGLLARASWGIGALEAICLAGEDEEKLEEVGYVPSMIFFGVHRKEAVWLRMVGVPRIVADGLAKIWEGKEGRDPATYDDIRNWVSNLTDEDWERVIPPTSSLTPKDLRLIWQKFTI